MSATPAITMLDELDGREVEALLAACGAQLARVPVRATIPGSYWGESEAGLIGNRVHARGDTPAHSLLHELCHFVCMDTARRALLATDAGGDVDEECGVCYLQVLLAERLTGFGRTKCWYDMDLWGYSFREGSARAWFHGDGVHARRWLLDRGLIDSADCPTLCSAWR